MNAKAVCSICLLAATAAAYQTENVFIVNIDGMRWQDDPVLAGAELASGRRAKDDAEIRGAKGKADTLHSVSAFAAASETARGHVTAQPSLVQLGLPAKYAATYFHDTVVDSMVIAPYRGIDGVERRRLVTRGWVSDSQQFLSRVLPGARFLRVLVGLEQHTEYWVRLADGQSFRVTPNGQMREILAAQSIRFDSSNADAAAKIAVLFAYCGRRIKTSPDSSSGYRGAEGPRYGEPDSLAFPSVEFRSFERGAWVSPGKSRFDGIWVNCVIDGVARQVFVMMSGIWSVDLRPSGVQSPDVSTGFVWNGGGGTRIDLHGALSMRRRSRAGPLRDEDFLGRPDCRGLLCPVGALSR